jgi:copper(I)-binding protein
MDRSDRRPMRRRRVFLRALTGACAIALAALTGTGQQATAHGYTLGRIAIGHVWAPPPEDGAAGIPVYGPLLNRGDHAVSLLGASSPIARSARFRIDNDGIASWPEALELAPGKPVSLAPWRAHIWLSGLRRNLHAGDSFDLTLDFGAAGDITVTVVVETAAGH